MPWKRQAEGESPFFGAAENDAALLHALTVGACLLLGLSCAISVAGGLLAGRLELVVGGVAGVVLVGLAFVGSRLFYSLVMVGVDGARCLRRITRKEDA